MKFHNMQISNNQCLENVFKHLKNKLEITENSPKIGIEALKTNVLMWWWSMSTTMKAAIHVGPNYTEILEVYKNTNSEEIPKLFGITQKLVWDPPDKILNVNQIPFWAWRRCRAFQKQIKDGKKPSGRISIVQFLRKITGNRWRTNWVRVEYFPKTYLIAHFFRRSRMICKIEKFNLKKLKIELSSFQCSTWSNGQRKETKIIVFQIQKKSRCTWRDSRKDSGPSSDREARKWYGS